MDELRTTRQLSGALRGSWLTRTEDCEEYPESEGCRGASRGRVREHCEQPHRAGGDLGDGDSHVAEGEGSRRDGDDTEDVVGG